MALMLRCIIITSYPCHACYNYVLYQELKMNTRHSIPGSPTIHSPLYLSSSGSQFMLPRLTVEVINKNGTMRVTIKAIFTYQVCDKLQSYVGRKPFDFTQSFVATLYSAGHFPLLYY